jgi:hypothetical protein
VLVLGALAAVDAGAAAGAAGAVDAEAASPEDEGFELPLPEALLPALEYKSAYQPPPFKMKLPPLIKRLTARALHLGQTSRGGSEIF